MADQPWTSAGPPEPGPDDHRRGDGPLVVEYADFECHHCALAHLGLRERPVTRVFRHFPVKSKHPRARVLAHAAEAAALQGRFWEMHDLLLEDQAHLDDPHLWQRAERLGLDLDRFERDRRSRRGRRAGGTRLQERDPGRRDQHAGLLRRGPPPGLRRVGRMAGASSVAVARYPN